MFKIDCGFLPPRQRCSRSNPGLRLWKPAAESCSRRPTLMQVLVHGMDFNAASSFRAACFHTSICAGDTLKRNQPRESDRRELLPLEHLRGTALVWLLMPRPDPVCGGYRASSPPGCSSSRSVAHLAPSSLVVTPSSEHRHTAAARRGEGGPERSRAVWRRWKRAGTAVNATQTGRRGLGTVLSGDGHCLARA